MTCLRSLRPRTTAVEDRHLDDPSRLPWLAMTGVSQLGSAATQEEGWKAVEKRENHSVRPGWCKQ